MNYLSTRGQAPQVGLSQALAAGLAPDGGLYMPSSLPRMTADDFRDCHDLAAVGERLLAPFFAADRLNKDLAAICQEAFSPAAPLTPMRGRGDYCLELFHGPTAAFKDFAARFLAACLSALESALESAEASQPLQILVATSGDTGAAVASAFHGRAGFRVAILYPDGGVSARQAHCLECWGENVQAFRVQGSFDDCQHMVKQALAHGLAGQRLTSANSISLGRLLPQMVYYAAAALTHWRASGERLNFIIPAGNLGNSLACVMARRMGLPIGDIGLACNANATVSEYFDGRDYQPRPSQKTLANAMDVGAPSNFERLYSLHDGDKDLRDSLFACSVDDERIASVMEQAVERHGRIPCPHTACALYLLERLRASGDQRDWAVVATAHPAKFEQVIHEFIGQRPKPPPALADCLARPRSWRALSPGPAALAQALTRE